MKTVNMLPCRLCFIEDKNVEKLTVVQNKIINYESSNQE